MCVPLKTRDWGEESDSSCVEIIDHTAEDLGKHSTPWHPRQPIPMNVILHKSEPKQWSRGNELKRSANGKRFSAWSSSPRDISNSQNARQGWVILPFLPLRQYATGRARHAAMFGTRRLCSATDFSFLAVKSFSGWLPGEESVMLLPCAPRPASFNQTPLDNALQPTPPCLVCTTTG